MRNNIEDSRLYNPRQWGGKWASVTQTLTSAYIVNPKGPISLFLDANGGARVVMLPTHDEGKFYCISHIGTTGTLAVQDSLGASVVTLLAGDSVLVESTGVDWISIGGIVPAVRYDQVQGLSAPQQQMARDNIGFDGAATSIATALISSMAVRYDAAQALTASQQERARRNIGTGPEIAFEQYGVVGDGVTDDTANMQLAIDAAELLDGCTLVGKPGAVYKTSGNLIIGGNGVNVDFKGSRIKMTGAALYFGLLINGAATALSSTTTKTEVIGANSVTLASVANFTIGDSLVVGADRPVITNIVGNVVTFAPVLTGAVTNGQTITRYPKPTVNTTIHTSAMTLSSTTGFAVGDYLYIRELEVGPPAYAWDLVAKIIDITGLVVTLDTQIPFAQLTTNRQTIYKITPRERCGVKNLIVDMREATNTACIGFYAANTANCTHDNITVWGLSNGIGFNTVIGRDNFYHRIRTFKCGGGSGSDQDIQFTSETAASISHVRSVESQGFGPTIALNSYTHGSDFQCYNPTHRGMKLQQSVGCNLNGIYVIGAGTTGFGLLVGSHRNVVSNVISKRAGRVDAGVSYGIWLDESNDNVLSNINSEGNAVWDILEQQCTGNILTGVKVSDTTKIALDAGVIIGLNGAAGPVWAAGPGFGREYISNIAAGSAVALTTATVANVTSLNLPAGTFEVSGVVVTNPNAATTSTALLAAVHTVSATMPTAANSGAYARQSVTYTTGAPQAMPTGTRRYVFTVPTTIYLVVQSNFAVNTNAAYGTLRAERIS